MYNLAPQYQWLAKEPGPQHLIELLKIMGTKEVPGAGNNPLILQWAKELGEFVGIDYKADSEAWCGIAAGIILYRSGLNPPKICVRASSWDAVGVGVATPALGDFLRFSREGGGHIGVYIGEDPACYHVGGGNQSDMVNITRISKTRLVAARRVASRQMGNVRRVHLHPSGAMSTNER